MITIRQLQALYWVAKLQNYSDAAEHLHLSPSALSKRLVELETIMGKAILDRSGYRIALTQFGRAFLERTGPFLRAYDELCKFGVEGDELEGHVSFGLPQLVALTWFPKAIASLRSHYPKIVLEPYVNTASELIERTKKGFIDCSVVNTLTFDEDLAYTKVSDVEHSLFISPKLLAYDASFESVDVHKYPVLTQVPDSNVTHVFNGWALKHGIEARKVLTINSLNAILQMVLAGIGAGFLPSGLCAPLVRHQYLIKLQKMPDAILGYYFVRQKGPTSELNSAVEALMISNCDFHLSMYAEFPKPDYS